MSHAFQALKYVIFFSRGFLVWFGFVLLGKPWEMEVKKERICLIQKRKQENELESSVVNIWTFTFTKQKIKQVATYAPWNFNRLFKGDKN